MQQGNSWKYQNDSFPILSVERIPRSFLRKGSGSSCCGTCAKNISILKEKQLKSIDCRLEKERERERPSAIRRSVTGNEPHMPREEVPPVLYEWDEAQTQVLETGLSLSQHANDPRVVAIESCGACPPGPRMFRGSQPAVDPQAVCPPVCLSAWLLPLFGSTHDWSLWMARPHLCVDSWTRIIASHCSTVSFSGPLLGPTTEFVQYFATMGHLHMNRHTQIHTHGHTERLSICQLRVKLRNSYETIFHPS